MTPTITTVAANQLLLLILGLLLVISCKQADESVEAEVFQVMKPIVKNVKYHHEYVAEILSVQYVEVRSRVKGYIERVHVDEGQVCERRTIAVHY